MLRLGRLVRGVALLLTLSVAGAAAASDGGEGRAEERTRILDAAAKLMRSAKFCALVTLDGDGHPQARAMDPFPPEPDMSVWLGTNHKTRKVNQIREDPRVTLYYLEPTGAGYVTLVGEARLVDDPAEKARRWKPTWKAFYDDEHRGEDFLLIHVVPKRVEVMSMPDEIASEPKGWKPAIIEFE